MMKKVMLLGLILVLFGCSTDYGGLKINKKITASQIAKCEDIAFAHALKNKQDKKIYNLYNKLFNEPGAVIDSPYYREEDYNQYLHILDRVQAYRDKCYYDLGYRLYPLIK